MPPSQMLRSVLQALALATLTDLISWNLTCNTWSSIEAEHRDLFTSFGNATGEPVNPGGLSSCSADRWDFFSRRTPRDSFRWLMLLVAHYYWHIWLERILPTRPKGTAVPVRDEKEVTNEDVEEKIVQKWIAQGKVRRSSISWANTIGKWMLELSLGNLWRCVLWILLQRIVEFKPSKWNKTFVGLPGNIGFEFIGCFLGPAPLVSLVGFIVIPAYQRIVFESGMHLVWTTFISAVLNVFVPWLMSLEIMQEGMRNASIAANEERLKAINESVEHEL